MANASRISLLIPINGTDTIINVSTMVDESGTSSTTDSYYLAPTLGGHPDFIVIDDDYVEPEDTIATMVFLSTFTKDKRRRFKRLSQDFHEKKSKMALKEFSKPKHKYRFIRQKRR